MEICDEINYFTHSWDRLLTGSVTAWFYVVLGPQLSRFMLNDQTDCIVCLVREKEHLDIFKEISILKQGLKFIMFL